MTNTPFKFSRRAALAALVVAGVGGNANAAEYTMRISHQFPPAHHTAVSLEQLAKGKETRRIDGRDYVLETPIHGDFALIKAYQGDRWGNLVFRKAARNFGPVMAMAARCTVAQVDEVVPLGALDPEHIITPGIFVHRVVAVGDTVMIGPAPGKGPKKP